MNGPRTLVVGAGVGGLVAAALRAARGHRVTVLEKAAAAGGKLRQVTVDGQRLDAGPTVFTMRWVFDELFGALGERLDDRLSLRPARILARHAWSATETLDLAADLEAAVEAIGAFSGSDQARRYRAFCACARNLHAALERPYLRAARPSLPALLWRCGWRGLPALQRASPLRSLWSALREFFPDPRLHQLFARYATYCGSSPFLAPATLMLIAHVEREGVWFVDGGMARVAEALASLAQRQGARLRCRAEVAEITVSGGRANGVVLADGERLAADAVVFNGDVGALAGGLLGAAAQRGWRRPRTTPSLSALTWHLVARTGGLPLHHHTVFFGGDYRAEFDALAAGRLPADPTVYLCAQDRRDDDDDGGPERLMVLVNAPARVLGPEEIAACRQASFDRLRRCGLTLDPRPPTVTTTPADFARLFPGTQGALYGPPTHGWRASFARSGSASPLPGLFLAGGSVHPGPGLPMAALSGQLAAASVLAEGRTSTSRWRPTAMPGGTSMR